MELNEIGYIAAKSWTEIPDHFPFAVLDEWIVMPNHVHGIIHINHPVTPSVETRDLASLHGRVMNKFGPLQKQSLQSVIHGFKSSVKRICNKNGHKHFSWQSRFWDHIIRDEKSLNNIREYIRFNPLKWESDRNNPESVWV